MVLPADDGGHGRNRAQRVAQQRYFVVLEIPYGILSEDRCRRRLLEYCRRCSKPARNLPFALGPGGSAARPVPHYRPCHWRACHSPWEPQSPRSPGLLRSWADRRPSRRDARVQFSGSMPMPSLTAARMRCLQPIGMPPRERADLPTGLPERPAAAVPPLREPRPERHGKPADHGVTLRPAATGFYIVAFFPRCSEPLPSRYNFGW